MTLDTTTLALGFVISFGSVFVKGFQHQNVIGGHFRLAFILSYVMAVLDVLFITLAASKGWMMVVPCGTGAALGITASMYLHRRFFK